VITKHQTAYKNYVASIAHFIAATILNKRVALSVPFVVVSYSGDLLPLSRPEVVCQFAGAIVAADLDKMKSIGYNETKVKGKNVLVFTNVSQEEMSFLNSLRGLQADCPSLMNAVNMTGQRIFSFTLRLISALLSTHYYPAFIDPAHAALVKDHKMIEDRKKRAGAGTGGPAEKRPRRDPGPTTSTQEEGVDEDIPEIRDEEEEEPETLASDKVYMATPSHTSLRSWGSIDNLPSSHYGVFAPYLNDLSSEDHKTVPSFIQRHLLPIIGNNVDQVRKVLESIRGAWGNLGKTPAGKELTHLVKCIDLALNAQAQAYPIFDGGNYEGTAILGAMFEIIINEDRLVPEAPDVLKTRILSAGSHTVAMKGIATIVKQVYKDDGFMPEESEMDGDVEITPIFSMMSLRNFCSKISLSENERDEIKKLAAQLKFSPRSLSFSKADICRAVNMLCSPGDIDDDLPISHTALFSDDRIFVIWSAFGAIAPTCFFEASPRYDLSKPKERPAKIMWSQTVLHTAVHHLKTLKSSKMLTVPQNTRRQSTYSTHVWERDDCREILTSLVHYVGGVTSEPAAVENAAAGGSVIEGPSVDLFTV